jgi:RNA recognition motif-containing protein
MMDQFTGRSRGFAFIDMNDSSEAKEAIKELNNSTLDGQFIIVDEARPKSRVNNESNKGGYSKFNDKRY